MPAQPQRPDQEGCESTRATTPSSRWPRRVPKSTPPPTAGVWHCVTSCPRVWACFGLWRGKAPRGIQSEKS